MQGIHRYYPTTVMTGSPSTYIKEENDDFSFNPHNYMAANNPKFNMNQQFGQYTTSGGDMSGVNPTDLTAGNMNGMNGFGHQNFMGVNSSIDDDDLLAIGNLDDNQQMSNMNGFGGHPGQQAHNYFPNGQGYTPDTNPIASPFVNQQFDYQQYATSQGQRFGSMPNGPRRHPSASDPRSPMTPTTPGMRMHSHGTPDSNNLQQQAYLNRQSLNDQARMHSASWNHNGASGSAGSGWDSPLSSPQGHFDHAQISEIMHNKVAASLPTKVENGLHSSFTTQEAKKKRRRESHNAVERRRRDNINERIHDLSRLVPGHRLEDEKVRKHLNNNSPLSPSLNPANMSPPHATSLLAGGTGRRAAGNITQGLPMEDKDKGPNKGDILNGAVSWTRDLMWQLYDSYKNEENLRNYIESQGLQWPLSETEDEKRMKSELKAAVEKNGIDNFSYSRGNGSGLRVPGHTTVDGKPLDGTNSDQVSPNSNNFGSWVNDNGHRDSNFSLKEEDESGFGMDMG